MAEELDVDAMIERFRNRASAVRNRPLPPIAGEERTAFIRQAQLDYQDFAIIGDATGSARQRGPHADDRPPSEVSAVASDGSTQAIAAIDAANADDPETIVVRGAAAAEGASARRAHDGAGARARSRCRRGAAAGGSSAPPAAVVDPAFELSRRPGGLPALAHDAQPPACLRCRRDPRRRRVRRRDHRTRAAHHPQGRTEDRRSRADTRGCARVSSSSRPSCSSSSTGSVTTRRWM